MMMINWSLSYNHHYTIKHYSALSPTVSRLPHGFLSAITGFVPSLYNDH